MIFSALKKWPAGQHPLATTPWHNGELANTRKNRHLTIGNFDLVGPLLLVPGGVPPGGGGGNYRRGLLYHFAALDFEKQKIRKKKSYGMPAPMDPPFFSIFFSFFDHRIPLLYLGSSFNAVVVFNLEVTHAARFALKTTAAFNEEPKKGNLAWKTERL